MRYTESQIMKGVTEKALQFIMPLKSFAQKIVFVLKQL